MAELKIPKKETEVKEQEKQLSFDDIPQSFQNEAKQDLEIINKKYEEKIQDFKSEYEKAKNSYINDFVSTYKLVKEALDEAQKTKRLYLTIPIPSSEIYYDNIDYWKKKNAGKWKVISKIYNDLQANGWKPSLSVESNLDIFDYFYWPKYPVECNLVLSCFFN